MRLLIIRHGESEADILKVHEGRADFPLTPCGHRQAEAMAKSVSAQYKVDRIYCSTLTRARQTAAHLSEATGVVPEQDERLMEFDNGLVAGLSHEEANEKYPLIQNLPLHASVYEQESALEFRFRAEYMLSKILSENAEDATVAIVAHGGTINQLIRALLRLPADSDCFFNTGDTGVHEWRVEKNARRLVRANDTSHTRGI